jgi:hypothetical protein
MRKILFLFFLILQLTGYSQDFEVSPLQLFFNSEPGESQTKYFKVINHKSTLETFVIKLSDYSINSQGVGSYEEAGSMRISLANYASIAPSFFELAPNEEKEVAVTIQQPADQYGSRWGVLLVSTAIEQTSFSADKGVSAGLSLSGRIVIDIFQTPGTNKAYKANISNLSELTEPDDSTRTFTALVNNLSDIITNCKAYLIATNIQTGEEFNFQSLNFTMYPKSSRKLELHLRGSLPKGTYSLAAILDYGSNTNLEGTQMMIQVE